jgi:vacuolar-type H+-ATPase subunit E/Vma4
VRVNPEDVALAGKYFPGAEIIPDRNITGGMDASTADGTIRIINTFEKRMERAWTDMLPVLIKDVYQEVSDGAPAAS